MSTLYKARVCAVGREEDVSRLLTCLLMNAGAYDAPEDRPPYSIGELEEQVQRYAFENGGQGDTFMYEMVSTMQWGDAEDGSCRMTVERHGSGYYAVCFSYDSLHAFQPHDWLNLHLACGRVLMVALRASEDFLMDKGEVIFSGGDVRDNWDAMTECWLYLMEQYTCGLPPEDAVEKLRRMGRIMEEEEYDAGVRDTLLSCMHLLRGLAEAGADPEKLGQAMHLCLERRDYARLWQFEYLIAQWYLWEVQHLCKWTACLESVLKAWDEEENAG